VPINKEPSASRTTGTSERRHQPSGHRYLRPWWSRPQPQHSATSSTDPGIVENDVDVTETFADLADRRTHRVELVESDGGVADAGHQA